MTNSWPTNWTRIPTLRLRNAAVENARAAAAECARRRQEREEADRAMAESYQQQVVEAPLRAL